MRTMINFTKPTRTSSLYCPWEGTCVGYFTTSCPAPLIKASGNPSATRGLRSRSTLQISASLGGSKFMQYKTIHYSRDTRARGGGQLNCNWKCSTNLSSRWERADHPVGTSFYSTSSKYAFLCQFILFSSWIWRFSSFHNKSSDFSSFHGLYP